jgi:hypothetical protein
MRRAGLLAFAARAALAAPGLARAAEPDCYDVLVSARVVRQSPTAVPDCGPECIVISWPWIDRLEVKRVIEGPTVSRRLIVLVVQHNDFVSDRPIRLRLRRNALGLFNVIRVSDSSKMLRCAPGTPPAAPYIRPKKGQSLRDLIRETEGEYRANP